jgi:hypothetical protein
MVRFPVIPCQVIEIDPEYWNQEQGIPKTRSEFNGYRFSILQRL